MKETRVACAIMAGGKNRRYNGIDKSFVEISGKPLIEMILEIVDGIFEEIIIVTNNPGSYDKYKKKYKIVSDEIKNIGPLGGFYTAMINSDKDSIFYLPCDMPFIRKKIIENQIKFFYSENNCDVLQPKIGELVEPMHSIYKTNLSDKLFDFIQNTNTYSILTFLRDIQVNTFLLEENQENIISFLNINSKSDMEEIIKQRKFGNTEFFSDLIDKRKNKAIIQDNI